MLEEPRGRWKAGPLKFFVNHFADGVTSPPSVVGFLTYQTVEIFLGTFILPNISSLFEFFFSLVVADLKPALKLAVSMLHFPSQVVQASWHRICVKMYMSGRNTFQKLLLSTQALFCAFCRMHLCLNCLFFSFSSNVSQLHKAIQGLLPVNA